MWGTTHQNRVDRIPGEAEPSVLHRRCELTIGVNDSSNQSNLRRSETRATYNRRQCQTSSQPYIAKAKDGQNDRSNKEGPKPKV